MSLTAFIFVWEKRTDLFIRFSALENQYLLLEKLEQISVKQELHAASICTVNRFFPFPYSRVVSHISNIILIGKSQVDE